MKIYFGAAFAPYGRVLGGADAALSAALAATERPAEGNLYRASVEALEALPLMAELRRVSFGGMEIQAGFCNGHGDRLNALEYHKCSELSYSTTGLVLLLALPSDLEGDRLDAGRIRGFYLPPETLVELYPRTLHFAPCRVREEGFDCLVVLEKGVNAPLERVDTSAPGEEKLLWMRGKWLICHPASPQAKKGAFVGIRGENIRLEI
ncbi:MAG: DUF4867 family protein [Oscillospiraceae bacterium]|nr:DUF4867 family protein [Oscillospiraceae bacterium]